MACRLWMRRSAGMSDRAFSEFIEGYIRDSREDDGDETIHYTPDWLELVAERMKS